MAVMHIAPPGKLATKMVKFFLAVTLLTLVDTTTSCSFPENYQSLSIAELTRRAFLVIQAKVVAVDTIAKQQGILYNATLNVTHVYKGILNASQIVVNGFGSSPLCRSEVEVGSEHIVFLDSKYPYSVRHDDISSAVAQNSTKAFNEITKGLCCPRTEGNSFPPNLIFCTRTKYAY